MQGASDENHSLFKHPRHTQLAVLLLSNIQGLGFKPHPLLVTLSGKHALLIGTGERLGAHAWGVNIIIGARKPQKSALTLIQGQPREATRHASRTGTQREATDPRSI